jgi:hypothetical protein
MTRQQNKLAGMLWAVALTSVVSSSAYAQEKRCPGLRALNGECTRVAAVEEATSRAMIMTTVRSSYFGTPIGTFGGQYIPYEKLFQDNPLLFGLPTYTFPGSVTFIGFGFEGFSIYTNSAPVRTK